MEERRQIVTDYKRRGLSISKSVMVAGMSRSSYYYRPKSGKPGRKASTHTRLVNGNEVSNQEVVDIIKELLGLDFVDYGYLKVTHWLNQHGYYISDDKVYRLMKENNLLNKSIKPSPARQYVKFYRVLPNRPFEVLEMDIKFIYIHGTGSNAMVLTILDTFTRQVLAWKCQLSIRKTDVKSLIDQLIIEHLQPNDLLKQDIQVSIRSDNGSQFIAKLVRNCLRENFIIQEFTRPATPQQNGHIESFHSIVRRSVEEKYEFESIKHLKNILEAFYSFYNQYRVHSSICYLSPLMFQWAWEQELVIVVENQKHQRKRFKLLDLPVNLVKDYYFANFALSSKAETGSAGEQPVRNNLTDLNSLGGDYNSPNFNKLFNSFMPFKTHNKNINLYN